MTVAVIGLADALQTLIDARLDTIDRMLLGRVGRADRLAIVRDVETQIHVMLDGRDPTLMTRDDVLEALGRLDPPEAYLPEPGEEVAPGRTAAGYLPRPTPARKAEGSFGRAGGIVGIVSLILALVLPLVYPLTLALDSELVFLIGGPGIALMAMVGAITAIVLAVVSRLGGAWSITALVTGIGSLLITGAAIVLFLFMLAS